MQSFEAITLIHAPVDRVWAVLADVVSWPRWLPTVTSVQALGSVPLGRRFALPRGPADAVARGVDSDRPFTTKSVLLGSPGRSGCEP